VDKNDNVREFLQVIGFNTTQATVLAQLQVVQQYCRIYNNKDVDIVQKNQRGDWNEMFDIQTIHGFDLFKMTVEQLAKYNVGCDVAVKDKWDGDVFVSEAMFLHGENASTVFYRMERKLQYQHSLQDSQVNDPFVMVVNSTLFIMDRLCLDFDGQMNVPNATISCSQVFVKTWDGSKDNKARGRDRGILGSPVERVPGCVANVKVRTLLVPIGGDDDCASYRVLLDGESDAVVSRGLLSVLRQALSSMDVQSVLDVDPWTVADQLGLRSVLSKGRNDGLASMMTVVQNQIRSLLGMMENNTQNQSLSEMAENSVIMTNQSLSLLPNQSVGVGNKPKPTVAMLLSGGVDSSVALNLLVRQGYNVTAFYLKIWLEDELAHLGQCPWEDDYKVCTQVCQQAGVPLESISLQNEYKEKVISYTIHEAKKGRTPNPDIMCNSRVKFGCFYDAISQRDFDHVATGHYAQLEEIQHSDGTVERKLLRAPDPIKDQSYFLAALTQEQLSKVLFPIGQFEKSRVRELAKEYDLPNKNRPDSQGLCFLGKVKFDEFLSEYLGTEPGNIVDAETNDIIGRHNGIWYHTVGQRKGLGKVLDPIATSRGPWYVVAKDTSRRLIIASNQYDEERFESTRREFFVEGIRWITRNPPSVLDLHLGVRLNMKIRHGPTIVHGTLQVSKQNQQEQDVKENVKDQSIVAATLCSTEGKIVLDKKDGGLAPGQFVVFYDGMECLGSAVISEKHWLAFFQSEESTMKI
jgi:tRNA-specific 2-thiouridylase